ncbi:beta-galactosidase, partial [Leuconostoc mesenteroides]
MTALTDKLGVNDYGMYFNNNIDYEKFKSNWDYDMQMMSRLPINWIRIGYGYWEANINPDGSFNFDRLDYAINSALANGFKVIIPFFATFDGYKTPPDYQTALQNFKKLVTETITHLRNKAVVFEAVDEAFSGNHFWMNQPIGDDVINDIMNINFLINQLSVA